MFYFVIQNWIFIIMHLLDTRVHSFAFLVIKLHIKTNMSEKGFWHTGIR